jgi:hypothetical protein
MRKNKSKFRFVESSFGQKVWSTFPVAQYRIASPYQNGAIVVTASQSLSMPGLTLEGDSGEEVAL